MNKQQAIFIFSSLCLLLIYSCKIDSNKDLEQKNNAHKPYINLSDAAITSGNLEKAIYQMDSVFRSIKKPNNWDKQYFYGACMWMYKELNKNEIALKYVDSNITVLKKINNKQLTAEFYSAALLQKGIIQFKLGNYNDAYNDFFEAKRILNYLEDSCSKSGPLDSYAMVLYQQKEFKLAKDAFIEELHVLETCFKEGDPKYWGLERILDNIGLCYTKMNELDSAKMYYIKAINILEKGRPANRKMNSEEQKRFNINMGVRSGNLAKVYIKSQPDSAIYLYKKAISLNEKGTSELGDAQLCMYQLANVQLQQKLYTDAFATLNKLRKSLDTAANLKAELGYKENLYQYYESTNQFKQAFAAQKNYEAFKDSIQKREAGINTTNINKELKDREQQLQIQLLQKDKNINRLYLVIGGVALLLVAIIASLLYKNYTKSKKQNHQLIQFNNEIKEEQQKTKEALRNLEISNKQKDRILNVVAHDLRNPISGIAALSKTLLEQSQEENMYLKMIEQTSEQSLNLINELLQNNAEKESLEISSLSVNKLIEKIYLLFDTKAKEKQIQLKIQPLTIDIVINIDEAKIERVLHNLVSNALKFSHVQSNVYVSVKQEIEHIIFAIKDEGIGIPKDMQKSLFEKVSIARRRGTAGEKSFGLGLSICKELITAHHGKIWVESEEGKGSCFYVELPIKV